MKTIRTLAILLAIGFAAGFASAQTSSATVNITVTAPPSTPAKVSIVPSAATIAVGSTENFAIAAAGSSATAPVPTGLIELLAKAPGANGYVLLQSLPLVAGKVSCSYPLPATAPDGVYSVEAAYGGDANYAASPDYK